MPSRIWPVALALTLPVVLRSADLPNSPGRAQLEKHCQSCHDLAKSVSLRQDRNGWGATLLKMVGLGMQATEAELQNLADFLATHYPAETLPPVDVNKARAIQLESRLSLRRSEAAAILRYRSEHGPFESLEELLAVPGIDVAKIEARKERIVFGSSSGS